MKSFTALLLLLLLASAVSSAQPQLQVEKAVRESRVKAGGEVSIVLRFKNPFGVELPVRIVDSNMIGGSGLDIQCMEHRLPSTAESELAYESFRVFDTGNYTLPPAKVTYRNPVTGREETVSTGEVRVEVEGNRLLRQAGRELTTIYSCGTMSYRSSSFSTGGSFSIAPGRAGKEAEPREAEAGERALWQGSLLQPLLLSALALLLLLILAYLWLRRSAAPEQLEEQANEHGLTEAERLLSEAEELLIAGNRKEAFEKVSQALRQHYAEKLDIRGELTASELLEQLRERGMEDRELERILSLCALVVFAGKKASGKELEDVLKKAGAIIKPHRGG